MRVLVVEHSMAMRRFLGFALGVFRYIEVDQASNGVEALELLGEGHFDLVLAATALPQMDGLQLLSEIQKKHRGIPVILLGRGVSDEVETSATELGAFCVLQRPVQAHEVRNAACGAVGHSISPLSKESDRRRSPRLQMAVTLEFETEKGKHSYSSWDISPYGAFLISDDPMEVGVRLKGVLTLPHMSEPTIIDCKVVHVRKESVGTMPKGFGVNFEHTPETQAHLSSAFSSPED